MCECGCSNINYQWKLLGADGFIYLFGVYSGCGECPAPAGVDIVRVKPGDQDIGDDPMSFPDLPVHATRNVGGIPVIDHEIVRKQVKTAILGTEITDTNGLIDEDWADVLAEEAIPDLRDAVWQTIKAKEGGAA